MLKLHAGPRRLRPTYDEGDRRPYRRITAAPLSPTIGAEIGGISLAEPMDDATFEEVHRALLEYKVIFFRDQDLNPEQHVGFARRFGDLETHPFVPHREGHPAVMVIQKNHQIGGYENVWHSDVTWRLEPSLGSVLLAREVPAVGGDTLFSDMVAAYEGLDEATRASLEGLRAVHDFTRTFGRLMSAEDLEKKRKEYPPAEHPVVRTHPETGRKALFVGHPDTCTNFENMTVAESRPLLDFLYAHSVQPDTMYRHMWRPGDLLMWDNRCTMHYAVHDYGTEVRNMHRVTVKGTKPV